MAKISLHLIAGKWYNGVYVAGCNQFDGKGPSQAAHTAATKWGSPHAQEFEQRFDATPGLKKAELIEGIVYVSPPVSHTGHSVSQANLTTVLGVYAANTPGLTAGSEGSVRLGKQSMPQPDVFLMIDPKLGGQVKVDPDDFVRGVPELVAEVAATTASIDVNVKLETYRKAGVRQYIVWRTHDDEFDFFVNRGGKLCSRSLTKRTASSAAAFSPDCGSTAKR